MDDKSVYQFNVKKLNGEEVNLGDYKNKVLLIVNTASQCGFTPQLKDLVALKNEFKDKNFEILAFPSNDFGGQEPGTNSEIKEFCKKNYGVTFPMAGKVDVVGDKIHPLFKYLTEEATKLGVQQPVIKWNFTKFLLDENGKLIAVFPSKVTPMSEELTKHLN